MLSLVTVIFVFLSVTTQCESIPSFTVHILYDVTSPDSVGSLNTLHNLFCTEFLCSECSDLTCDLLIPGATLVTSHGSQYRVPLDLAEDILPWFMQFRTSRVRGAGADLDIAVHPDTVLGVDHDYRNHRVWGGRNHPVDTNNIYQDNPGKDFYEGRRTKDEDDWAFTCSSDATGEVG